MSLLHCPHTSLRPCGVNKVAGVTCIKGTGNLDKAPRASINIVIWILSSDTICQLKQLFSNSEAAMLSKVIVMLIILLGGNFDATNTDYSVITPITSTAGTAPSPTSKCQSNSC